MKIIHNMFLLLKSSKMTEMIKNKIDARKQIRNELDSSLTCRVYSS